MTWRNWAAVLALCVCAAAAGCDRKGGVAAPSQAGPAAAPGAKPPGPSSVKPVLTIEYDVKPSILFEAEAGVIHAPMEVVADAAASEGKCIATPEGPNHALLHKEGAGDAVFRFQADKAGDYTIWLRAKWCCACGNSVNLTLDGAPLGTVEDPTLEAWHWVRLQPRRPKIAAGPHTLVIVNREDGASVDQVLMTQDGDYRPTDIETADARERTAGVVPAAAPAAAPDAAPAATTTTIPDARPAGQHP